MEIYKRAKAQLAQAYCKHPYETASDAVLERMNRLEDYIAAFEEENRGKGIYKEITFKTSGIKDYKAYRRLYMNERLKRKKIEKFEMEADKLFQRTEVICEANHKTNSSEDSKNFVDSIGVYSGGGNLV